MLVIEQRLSASHPGRNISLRARFVHGVQARGWRMKFSLLKAEVEVDADPETYRDIARRLKTANVHVRPARVGVLNVAPRSSVSPVMINKPVLPQAAIMPSPNQMKPIYCQDSEMKVSSPPCHSPGAILPDLPQAADDQDKSQGLSKEASSADTQAWLARHRFSQHAATFSNFSGADLLRLSRDDIIQICGLPDGIRLFNALHAKRIEPRLTLYVCSAGAEEFSALFLHSCTARELTDKLRALPLAADKEFSSVCVWGPGGARVRLTDEVVRHLPDGAALRAECAGAALLLCPTQH